MRRFGLVLPMYGKGRDCGVGEGPGWTHVCARVGGLGEVARGRGGASKKCYWMGSCGRIAAKRPEGTVCLDCVRIVSGTLSG